MIKKNKGMTKFYNDFHNPEENDDELTELRTLQRRINELVIQRYGWTDIELEHDFHQADYLPAEKNLRYTISERARGELLYRLLILNRERFQEENE